MVPDGAPGTVKQYLLLVSILKSVPAVLAGGTTAPLCPLPADANGRNAFNPARVTFALSDVSKSPLLEL